MRIKVKLIGFVGGSKEVYVDVEGEPSVGEIVSKAVGKVVDEIMVLCKGKQLYLDDKLDPSCEEIEVFPLAHGG